MLATTGSLEALSDQYPSSLPPYLPARIVRISENEQTRRPQRRLKSPRFPGPTRGQPVGCGFPGF
jgi:hypothetical protein